MVSLLVPTARCHWHRQHNHKRGLGVLGQA